MPSLCDIARPDDPEQALTHLRVGTEMAWTKRGDQVSHTDVVWSLVEEAVEVMDRLPDREKAWMRIGSTAAGFSGGAGLTRRELQALEQLRYLSAMMPHDGVTARVIDREQGQRAFDVMLWLRWIGVHVHAKDPRQMVKAAVALARGGDCEAFHRIWRPGAKPHRQAVKNFRVQVCGHIIEGLRRDLGLIPVQGGHFAHLHHIARYLPEALHAAG